MRRVKVAVIQEAPVFLNLAATVDRACELIAETAARGARLIVFPETWLPGYPVWLDLAPRAAMWNEPGARALFRVLSEQSLTVPGDELSRLHHAAREHLVYAVLGAHERVGGTLYNTQIFLGPGDSDIELHRKLMPTYNERLIWGRGDGSTLATMKAPFGNIGGLICWEHWMPAARAAMHALGETIHAAQWPAVGEIHQIASRHYAFEGGCFVIAAGCCLTRDQVLEGFDSLDHDEPDARKLLEQIESPNPRKGGSAIIGPDGAYLAEPVYEDPATRYAELDMDRLAEHRMFMDADGHYARPDVFQLTVNTRPQKNVTFDS
ncbi:MAG: carbon-nitrogen hydrolase family protein [Acidobacteriota bacterium]|nr:carbon-nitrogen hydrolase family protein [Acidobacteriota bacterium]